MISPQQTLICLGFLSPLTENFNTSIIKEKNSVVCSHAQILNKMGSSQYIGPKFQIVARLVLCYLLIQNRVPEGLEFAEIIPVMVIPILCILN